MSLEGALVLRASFATWVMVAMGLSLAGSTRAWAADKASPVDFNRDILPLLSDQCFTCHGPDAKKRDADLRLDTREGIFEDRGGYKTVTPGNSGASELFARVSTEDDFELMPPGHRMTQTQVALIKRWIDEGATYEAHWAYVAPKRPPVPEVKAKSWPRNPIDYFVLSRLEAEGLRPSPEADRATLLRRVSYDLTGLPPTPTEVKAFLEDRSSNAYQRQVDRLLASPRYGENMARMWLDLARYADSNGDDVDWLRGMWPWRDWVINAYNRNMPYDQFTIRQLAGDLLPDATLEDKIATGFNRNNMGIISENGDRSPVDGELRAEMVADRVSTTGTAWLGLTFGCARCHDHKYDPIKQKDFYRLAAYFNNVPEFNLADFHGNTEPVVAVPSSQQREQLESLNADLSAALARLPEKGIVRQENQWRASAAATIAAPPKKGLLGYYSFENTLTDSSGLGHDAHLVRDHIGYRDGVVGRAGEFNGTTHVDFGDLAAFDRTTPFALSLWTNPKRPEKYVLAQKRDAATNWTGLEIALDDLVRTRRLFRISVRLASHWPDDAIEIRSKDHVIHSQYVILKDLGIIGNHLVVNYDGSGKAAGLRLYVDGQLVETEILKDHLTGSSRTPAPLSVGDSKLGPPYRGVMDELRVYNRALSDADIKNLYTDAPAGGLISSLRNRPTVEIVTLRDHQEAELLPDDNAPREAVAAIWQKRQHARLSEYFLTYAAPQPIRESYAHLEGLRAQKTALENAIPTTQVMAEATQPMDTFVLGRGKFANQLEKVTAGVPGFLLPLPANAPSNRLALARWLVNPDNPLTARVAVNRYWQSFFGIGIVKTAEDFGAQGERPTHPQLLDWLATEFIRTGWDIKSMQRLIVMSATYRQSSQLSTQLERVDPENRLFARGPRVRLAAEEIRDSALAMSGLLTEQVGGPSVYPYQPAGLWLEVSDEPVYYNLSSGPDLYRRSLYTIWRRSVPAPSFAAFDLPSRETCVARRIPTTTPLQALVLLNDPTYVEASRALAERTIREADRDPGERVDFLFRWAVDRSADVRERQLLSQEAQRMSIHFRRDPQGARQLLEVGDSRPDPHLDPAELAAWTMVARTVLNMDETITKQ
jgi:cytochrome c553